MAQPAMMSYDCGRSTEGMDGESQSVESESALQRVASLPIVLSTWTAMHSYYTTVKKTYPTVTPYLEVAENVTSTAVNLAVTTSRPVVDKYGSTLNSYANFGLDQLEEKVPLITKEPKEVYEKTKSTASSVLSSPVDSALCMTEKYVEYYLPSDEEDVLSHDEDDSASEEGSEADSEDMQELKPDPTKNHADRIRDISNKVRRRSYKQAMKRWHGVHARSKEALSRLHFTVDLIQYAQSSFNATSDTIVTSANLANEKLQQGLESARSNLQIATTNINKQVEENVLVHAQKLTEQLNETCSKALQYLEQSPRLHYLMEKAAKAKVATEELYTIFADKTSLNQISASVAASARPKMQLVEEALLQILEDVSNQPPVSWLMNRSGLGSDCPRTDVSRDEE